MTKLMAAVAALLISSSVMAQSELPDTQIKDMQTGKKIAFNKTVEPGKITLVNIWATWCVPCKSEIKHVREKLPKWKEEVDFNYMTISLDEARSEGLAKSYAKSQGWDFPYYIDANSDLKRSLNFQNPPFTLLVDQNGKVVYTHTGYEVGGEEEVWAKIKELSGK